MLKLAIFLVGPTIMIYFGLIVFKSVPVTFFFFYGWLLLVPLFYYIKNGRQRINIKELFSPQSTWIGLMSGVVFLAAIYGGITFLKDSIIDLNGLKLVLIEWNFTGNLVFWLVIFLIVVNPLLEELYWREFMYKRLLKKLSVSQTILITAFFYSLYHLISLLYIFTFPFNLIAVIPIFIVGIIWAYLRYKLKSITPSIISHIIADLGIMLVYLNYIY